MFTGLIEEKGVVSEKTVSPSRPGFLVIEAYKVLDDLKTGDSVNVSGVCQTVVEVRDSSFTVEVMPETLRRSTLGEMQEGSAVNLERALRLGDRLGGHIVNGHIDAVGRTRNRKSEENAVVFTFGIPSELTRYVAPKGSVAIDGISLTVVTVTNEGFSVSIIPHTLGATTLQGASVGTRVNVEVDVLAKYTEAILAGERAGGGLAKALLKGGFIGSGELG